MFLGRKMGNFFVLFLFFYCSEELLYFFDGLVRHAGSKANAARALRQLVGEKPPAVRAWEGALAKAEVAGGRALNEIERQARKTHLWQLKQATDFVGN